MYNFELVKPTTIADAVQALGAEDAQALGGGQTLIPTMKQRLAAPAVLVSTSGIAEMQRICLDDAGRLCIGGATTHAVVAAEAAGHYPGLAALAGMIGDPAVRNRGTLGGSLANNDPAACYPAAVLGSGAMIVTNVREIAADDYFQGMFATALDEGEIVTEVKFPMPQVSNYQKFVQPASRFALTGVFVARYADGVRVAVTGASENGVFRWEAAEQGLTTGFSLDMITRLGIDPEGMIADLHGTAAYRAHLVKVMTTRAVLAAI